MIFSVSLVCTHLVLCTSYFHFTGDCPPPNAPPKRPRKYACRSNEEGVLVDERVTRQREQEAAREKEKQTGRVKRKANRGKSTRINYKVGMDSLSYSSMRQKDWFEDEEREEGLQSFWCSK